MKKIIILFFLASILFLTACSDKEKEIELQNKITELENQLDQCQNGADKIYAKMKLSFEQNDFKSCKDLYREMEERHPDSELFSEVQSIYDKIIENEKNIIEKEQLFAKKKNRETKLKADKLNKEKQRSLKKLKKTYDDVSGIAWYKQPYFTHYNNRNLTSIYMGEKGSYRWLRLKMSYSGDGWIFFEKAYLSYDGNTIEIIFDKYDDKESDNGGGVWEWIDLTVNKDVEEFLREFAKSKNAKMRLSGKYTKTRILTYNERRGILDVLNGYDALKQGLNK